MEMQLLLAVELVTLFSSREGQMVRLFPELDRRGIKPMPTLRLVTEQEDLLAAAFKRAPRQFALWYGDNENVFAIAKGLESHVTVQGVLSAFKEAGAEIHYLVDNALAPVAAVHAGSMWQVNNEHNPGMWLKSKNSFNDKQAWLSAWSTLDELKHFASISLARVYDPLEASLLALEV